METSDIISIIAIFVALLSFPINYWLAAKQVRNGLEANERRQQVNSRNLLADRLDEFVKIYCAAVQHFTGITYNEINKRVKEINPHSQKIDKFVLNTKILDRISFAINNLEELGYANLTQDIVNKLQSIRGQIELGSDDSRYASHGVLSIFGHNNELQTILRNKC